MKNGALFGLAGLWENWKDPASGDWVRTFTIITVPSNELIARIHDRMPAILRPADYERWLGSEPDPHDLLIMFPSEPMKMWPSPNALTVRGMMTRICSPRSTSPRRREQISLNRRPGCRRTLGRAVAGLNAYAKGVSLGLL
jgi:putative SOS response-associated peptidase YedK